MLEESVDMKQHGHELSAGRVCGRDVKQHGHEVSAGGVCGRDVKQHGHEVSAGGVWAVVPWGLDRRMFRWVVSLCVARARLVAPI